MTPFVKGLIIGMFIGANIGVIVVALCVAAKRGDRSIHEDQLKREGSE